MGNFATAAIGTAMHLAQSQRQAKARNAASTAGANAQIQQIQQAQKIRERQLRERARQIVAQQRASFGALGIRGGGSANAVLRGLNNETARAIRDDQGLNALRIGDLNGALAERRRQNLLDASQAQQRQVFSLLSRGLKGFSLLD